MTALTLRRLLFSLICHLNMRTNTNTLTYIRVPAVQFIHGEPRIVLRRAQKQRWVVRSANGYRNSDANLRQRGRGGRCPPLESEMAVRAA